jgi:hypothetical protein
MVEERVKKPLSGILFVGNHATDSIVPQLGPEMSLHSAQRENDINRQQQGRS